MNEPGGGKSVPNLISPGGRVVYESLRKLPQLPAPDVMQADYPFIRLDNWLIYIFPMRKRDMAWLSSSTAQWVRQKPTPAYRLRVWNFINEIERLCFCKNKF